MNINKNREGKAAHEDFVKFMHDLGYGCYIAEREIGQHATAIFFK